jgi:hypothetical protein
VQDRIDTVCSVYLWVCFQSMAWLDIPNVCIIGKSRCLRENRVYQAHMKVHVCVGSALLGCMKDLVGDLVWRYWSIFTPQKG